MWRLTVCLFFYPPFTLRQPENHDVRDNLLIRDPGPCEPAAAFTDEMLAGSITWI